MRERPSTADSIAPDGTAVRRGAVLIPVLVLALAGVFALAQASDPFFESNFDGAWSGTVALSTPGGKESFPIALNIDVRGSEGGGSLLIADTLDAAPSAVDLLPLDGVSAKGKKVTLTTSTLDVVAGIEAGFTHTLTLRYKAKSGSLRGTLTSTDPNIGKGKVVLTRSQADRPVQGVWTGTANLAGGRGAVILQLEQDDATSGPGQEAVSGIGGTAIVGDEFGSIVNATFDGRELVADVRTETRTVHLDLQLKKRALRGKIEDTSRGPAMEASLKLLAAGARAKGLSVSAANPSDVAIGTRTEVTVRGKNFSPGSLLHTDNADVSVDSVEVVSTKALRAGLTPAAGLAEGVEIAVRIVGPDGIAAERTQAFVTVSGGGSTTVSFAAQIQPVFTANCALSGCHTGPGAEQGMDLSSGNALGDIVNVPSNQMPALSRIEPGDPDDSYLIRKIRGQGISGSRMPRGAPPLADDVIALFETWVREGAQNN